MNPHTPLNIRHDRLGIAAHGQQIRPFTEWVFDIMADLFDGKKAPADGDSGGNDHETHLIYEYEGEGEAVDGEEAAGVTGVGEW